MSDTGRESMRNTWIVPAAVGIALGLCAPVWAAAPETQGSADLRKAFEQLQKRVAEQDRKIQRLESQLGGGQGRALGKEEIRKIVEEMLVDAENAMTPGWMENLTFFGDFRLRYEYRRRAESTGGVWDDEGRARYRLRFGLKKKWPQDDLEVGFRIASGSNGGAPTSTNETMNDAFFRDAWDIDRAYARWTPKSVPGLLVTGGKIAQPWVATDLVWDSDLNPEGIWVQYDVQGLGDITPFVALGAFFIGNVNPGDDANMNTWSTGYHWKLDKDLTWTQAFTFYETYHYVAGLNSVEEEWDYFNLINIFKFTALNLPMQAYVDWVHNCGANRDTPNEQMDGIKVGLKVGKNKKKGDWSTQYAYRYMQMEASPPAFNDGDFPDGHKGHEWDLAYSFTDYMTGVITLIYAEPIYNPNVNGDRTTLHLDLMWKF